MLCSRAFVLCAGRMLRARAELLRARAELRLCPEVLPQEVPSAPLLPSKASSESLLCAELLCSRAFVLCAGRMLRARAELRLCPEVLPHEVPSAPLLPSPAPPESLLRAELLRPGLRTELRLR